MNTTGDAKTEIREVAVEVLLEQAAPRPVPPVQDEKLVRDAVRAKWRAVTGKRRARRRLTQYAVAASALLAVAVVFNVLRTTGVAPVQVATIHKEFGSIHLLGEQSELTALPSLTTIVAGQTIVTGDGAGLGLTWRAGNGSLRIDENTSIEFTSPSSVYLRSGRIYFDSAPATRVAAISSGSGPAEAMDSGSGPAGSGFVIMTDHGEVTHLGTQYMTAVNRATLTVSVREGEVEIDGRYTAQEGQQLKMSGGGSPDVTDIGSSGAAWAWVEATSPSIDADDLTTDEFIRWVGRETGLKVVYETFDAESTAKSGKLKGTIEVPPREALSIWMSGEDVRAAIDQDSGTITVTSIDSGS